MNTRHKILNLIEDEDYFDEILHAEENARETIEGAIKEKYIIYTFLIFNFFI